MGNAGQTNYAASKGGVEALTRSLAREIGSRGDHRQRGRARLHRHRHDAPSCPKRCRQRAARARSRWAGSGLSETWPARYASWRRDAAGLHHRPGDPRERGTDWSRWRMDGGRGARSGRSSSSSSASRPRRSCREASFIDDLGADSLDIVELVMAIEEEFGLEIPDEDAERMQNIGDVISYVEERTAGRRLDAMAAPDLAHDRAAPRRDHRHGHGQPARATTSPTTWSALLKGVSGIAPLERFAVDDLPVKFGGADQGLRSRDACSRRRRRAARPVPAVRDGGGGRGDDDSGWTRCRRSAPSAPAC